VRHARAKQITFVVQENLRLVNQPAKGRGVNDAVAVALMGVAHAGGMGGK
jgi:Holliday junction resolvasome RuvABC endonuclease subunit